MTDRGCVQASYDDDETRYNEAIDIIMIFQYLYKPFYVIRQNKANFTIWFLFTILGGNLGLASNVLIRKYINNLSLTDSISIGLP